MELPAIQEILKNYVAGTQAIVETSLSSSHEQSAETALFALRAACIRTQLVLATKQDPERLEQFAGYVLSAIKVCATIDANAPVNENMRRH